MKSLAILLSALSLAVASPYGQPQPRAVSYDGYQVFRVPVGLDASKVTEIVEKLELDTWKAPNKAGAFADVVVSPDKLQAFNEEVAGIEGIEVMHEDLGASIAAEQEPASEVLLDRAAAAINSTWFTAYHTYAQHLSFLSGLQAQYPANSEIVTSGNSLQGNAITGIHIYGSSGKGVKPAIIFHGTVHAREWITTMVCDLSVLPSSCIEGHSTNHTQTVEYFANILLSDYATNAETKAFVDKYDFYLFPVVNPDGKLSPRLLIATRVLTVSCLLMLHRLHLHADRPPVAQEQADDLRKQLSGSRHQPQLALPVERCRWCLHEPLR